MGYFSNGTEGELYLEHFCVRCVHWKDVGDGREDGCPVYDLHVLYNYGQLKDASKRHLLDSFIPRDASGGNGECRMFAERVEVRE